MLENFENCLSAVTVHVFPNNARKLQKWYNQHMMHKPRHMSTCKWNARVIKLNTYLMKFPTPGRVEASKIDQEEILEVLENRIPTMLKFHMDKEGTTLKEEGSARQNTKQMKRITTNRDKLLHNITEVTVDVNIASAMDL
eukprot:2988509-Ditylum_brightwellii.AAC.1